MSWRDLLELMRRNWVLFVIIPIVSAMICAGFIFTQVSVYAANAHILLLDEGEVAETRILAIMESSACDELPTEVEVSVSVDYTKAAVYVSATGEDPQTCVDVANEAIIAAAIGAGSIFPEAKFLTEQAKEALLVSDKSWSSIPVAAAAGLFIAFALAYFFDRVRQTIRNDRDAHTHTGLPLIGRAQSQDELSSMKLFANIQFAVKDARTLCLVPVGETETVVENACSMMAKGAEIEGKRVSFMHGNDRDAYCADDNVDYVVWCAPRFVRSALGSYLSNEAEAVILVLNAWETTVPELEDTLYELQLAEANVLGFILGGR